MNTKNSSKEICNNSNLNNQFKSPIFKTVKFNNADIIMSIISLNQILSYIYAKSVLFFLEL